ncbi:NAD(P)H-dependent oxidoreductase [Staphylococcus edaphicus]|uniref:NAD(P)H oxidoreductase n=1 Tax=Staphylococcus edaphicus TaxID=1955013 RepID=A0A2C6WPI1_9STAP|nr:NAD(P)H-dependent oxidoreductase [Staphylococcus edaphicus]PHK49656.1 NAD(P)H oxidoreductase [Staphylococcus edaphicus]UQW81922.1 NAD(P)H-dependent oxidoreductase [Staphylococcus edaphicus]
MSTLVIIAHPDISNSTVNKKWRDALSEDESLVTVHELYPEYPHGKIDIEKEQKLIEAHEHIIFQYPLYWYSSPPLMKQYLDEVFTRGWAYGSNGHALQGKNIGLAISIGSVAEAYTQEGNVKFTIDELVSPMIATTRFVSANYIGVHKLYSAFTITPSQLEENTQDYLNFIKTLNTK